MDYSDAHQADRRSEVKPSLPRGDADQLGPYTLIAEISAGEFTTVHLAHKRGPHGFDRLVAIKRLKPAYARQPEWSQLLLDEARLGASVDHPNTVDILDVGTDAGVYVVMDYVEGADLEQLLARAGRERHPRFVLPPIIDALTGLHAIHTQKDELGEPLAMVHQAPRARHILVGIHGTARVTDFSQVTARGLIPSTLRGKGLSPAYMAPEQVLVSEPVSPRTDVFILGVTLWEALTGERLFVGETSSLVRRAITERDIPKPSEVGLAPPHCFDGIVMRALQRNPELRYPSAAEFARELREVAQQEGLLATSSEVGQWVRALASRTLLERRRALGVDDRSEEIAIDVLEKQIAADRARKQARPAVVTEPVDETALPVHDHELRPIEPALPVTPSITVPVRQDATKREPTQELKTPATSTKRSATGTLIGVTAKPRSVGLPPPSAAALQIKSTGVPPYRGSLGRTAQEGPRIEIKQPKVETPAKNTLPEGAAFLSELELPIDLPAAKSARTPSFVGFGAVIDVEAEPVTPTPAKPSFGGAAAVPSMPVTSNLRETHSYGASASSSAAAPSAPTPFNGVSATMEGVGASIPPPSWPAPPVAQAPASAAPAWTPPPASASGWSSASPHAWTTPPSAAPGGLGATREEKRRSEPPVRSEPPARNSRPSGMHTLDGNVPKDVFERLRAAGGADSWRPPSQAVRQPWHDEEVEPRGYGRTFAIAAAIAVAGFFGYQHLTSDASRATTPVSTHAASQPVSGAPVAVQQAAPQPTAPQPTAPQPTAPQEAAPQEAAPKVAAPEPPPVVPPVSFGGAEWQAAERAPEAPAQRPAAVAPRAPVQRAEPLARPEPRPEPFARPLPNAQPASPAAPANPAQRLAPSRPDPLARPQAQPLGRPRSAAAYRPEVLPDNPY